MACIIARQRGPREVTLARYIPLSANRRLIIINHYPVYRLCTLACVSLPLSLLRKSSEAGCLRAPYLSYGRGEGERRAYVLLRTFSRPPFEVHRGIIALTPPSAMVISTGKIDRTNFFSHHPFPSTAVLHGLSFRFFHPSSLFTPSVYAPSFSFN